MSLKLTLVILLATTATAAHAYDSLDYVKFADLRELNDYLLAKVPDDSDLATNLRAAKQLAFSLKPKCLQDDLVRASKVFVHLVSAKDCHSSDRTLEYVLSLTENTSTRALSRDQVLLRVDRFLRASLEALVPKCREHLERLYERHLATKIAPKLRSRLDAIRRHIRLASNRKLEDDLARMMQSEAPQLYEQLERAVAGADLRQVRQLLAGYYETELLAPCKSYAQSLGSWEDLASALHHQVPDEFRLPAAAAAAAADGSRGPQDRLSEALGFSRLCHTLASDHLMDSAVSSFLVSRKLLTGGQWAGYW